MDEADRQELFRLLYQANYVGILGYALRRAESGEDAADVVAETFLTAWRRLDDVPPGTSARLWLYGVARRVLANQHRGERRRSRLAERLREDINQVESSTPLEVMMVKQALGQLREEDRDIIGLAAWEGLSHEEVGKVLGCKIRLHRARSRLMTRLSTTGGGATRLDRSRHEEGGPVSALPAMEEES